MRRASSLLAAAGLCIIAAVQAQAGQPAERETSLSEHTLFRLGTFGRSAQGFIDLDFVEGTRVQPALYKVRAASDDASWFATQRVASSTSVQPISIAFVVDKPARAYNLRVAVMTGRISAPALRVTINGEHGTFPLHEAHNYAELSFSLPGTFLHTGGNRITLEAASLARAKAPSGRVVYDAVELDRLDADNGERQPEASIEPAVFFRKTIRGLKEEVDVFLRHREPFAAGSIVELRVAGVSYRKALDVSDDFGEIRTEFEVPEFGLHTQASVRWGTGPQQHVVEQAIDPQKKWTLLVVPQNHLDVGFTDYQPKIAALQSHDIDQALTLLASNRQFRFSLDGFWPLEQFLQTRSAEQRQRALRAIEQRRLFVPADYANLLTGVASAETLIRSLYPSANFSRLHGTPFDYASLTDVPSYSWSYASILASAGIHDFVAGSDNIRGPVLVRGGEDAASPLWWAGPDGGRVLLWYSNNYGQLSALFGADGPAETGHDSLAAFLRPYDTDRYAAHSVVVYGSQGENTNLHPGQATVADAWNKLYAFPRMEYMGFHDALQRIAAEAGDHIATLHGDGGPYWEDGVAADARYAALERQNEARGPSAEKLTTLTAMVNPLLAADKQAVDRMWSNMVLMDEHTTDSRRNSFDPTTVQADAQSKFKEQLAEDAARQADAVAKNAMASISNSLGAKPGDLVVFNTLNWERDGAVSVDIEKGDAIIDAVTGETAPLDTLRCGNFFCHVRFVAHSVPGMGHKIFRIQPDAKPLVENETHKTKIIESPYYRVELDVESGAIRSLYDKELKRELVDAKSPYRFGQYLHVSGGDELPNSLLQYNPVYPAAKLAIHAAHGGSLVSVERTADGWLARIKSSSTNTPEIVTTVRLFNAKKQVELVEDITKTEVFNKEAVYIAFPFAMARPRFQYDIQNGVVDPARDIYPGGGQEWFSVQHWVSVEQNGVAATVMPLDTPLVTLGDINRGIWPTTFGQRQGTIFSYVMNNYWYTNYRAGQGGQFRFRYIITSARKTDAPSLTRLGWEETTPLEVNQVVEQEKPTSLTEVAPKLTGIFVGLDDPNLLLDTMKPAEDGKGTILRFLDLGGVERTVDVGIPVFRCSVLWRTDAVERNLERLPCSGEHGFRIRVHAHEIVTVRVGSAPLPNTNHHGERAQ